MIKANGEALWQVLRMYDAGSKVLNCSGSMNINILPYGRANV